MLRYLFPCLIWGYLFYRLSVWDVIGLTFASGFLLIALVGFLYQDKTRSVRRRKG
jgi:hypothetical protein